LVLTGFGNLLLIPASVKQGRGINKWGKPMEGLAMAMKDAEPVVAKAGAERRHVTAPCLLAPLLFRRRTCHGW
jgi:hypothetical protein